MRIPVRRPSPALVVASLALILSLGGTAVAANLISGGRLKNRSVRAKKIKKNTLTGTEIRENKLGTVPRARFATGAGTALNSGAVGGLVVRKLHFNLPRGTDDVPILNLYGLELIASCPRGAARLLARSGANNADLRVQVVSASGAAATGSSNFDLGRTVDLRAGKPSGTGTLIYNRREPPIVVVTYAFAGAPSLGGFRGCAFAGTATGG